MKAAINTHLCMPGVPMHSSQGSWKSLESMCSPGQVLYREPWHLHPTLYSWLTDRSCIASWEGGPGRASPTQHEEGPQNLLHRAVQELPRVLHLTLGPGTGRRIPHTQQDCLSCLRQENTAICGW